MTFTESREATTGDQRPPLRRSFRIWIAEHLLHLGWAMLGQECDCGHNRFNWLARLIGDGKWTADHEPADFTTRVKFFIGHNLVLAHGRLIP